MSDDSAPADGGRRRFLKIATCALGGGIGAAAVVPAAKFLLDPVGQRTVTSADEPIDVGPESRVEPGAPPVRVGVIAPSVRDGWGATQDVALGAAWLWRAAPGAPVQALSAVCPHLGCAIGFDVEAGRFRCPCHRSEFSPTGAKLTGPVERDMDPLPIAVENGRLLLTWVRYRAGGPGREKI